MPRKERGKAIGWEVLLVLAVLLLDWLSKSLVVESALDFRVNTGGAFSLFEGRHWFYPLSAWFFIFILGYWILFFKKSSVWVRHGLALIVGGSMGNALDRLQRGGVVDFISWGVFPSFNLADVAIVIGLAAIILAGMLPKYGTKNSI